MGFIVNTHKEISTPRGEGLIEAGNSQTAAAETLSVGVLSPGQAKANQKSRLLK